MAGMSVAIGSHNPGILATMLHPRMNYRPPAPALPAYQSSASFEPVGRQGPALARLPR